MLDYSYIEYAYEEISEWLLAHIFLTSTLVQFCAALAIFLISFIVGKKLYSICESHISKRWNKKTLDRYNEEAVLSLISPVIGLLLLWVTTIFMIALNIPSEFMEILAKLVTAWIIIRLTSSLLRFHLLSKVIAIFAWSIAALSITELLEPTTTLLDSVDFTVGELRISILMIIKGVISLVILLWLSSLTSRILERKIRTMRNLTPSVRVLMIKSIKLILVTLAILIGISSLGIDLTALTVFGGAIGLGLGFGLQKVVSNLVCGIILLLDRSIKPGDVVEVGGTYGWVDNLGARHVSVLTRDGVEHLIPNEHMITEKVVNWSYSHPNVRLKIPVSISYKSDVRKAMALVLEAAVEDKRVLGNPEPGCRLVEFGESAINLELRLWIGDPAKGIVNVRSNMLLAIWDKFKENEIEIPFPQQDVYLKPSDELKELIKSLVVEK